MVLEGGKKVLFHAPRNEIYGVCYYQGHVNLCFALTLSLRCSATSDSLNPALDSFSQGSLIVINIPVLFLP